MDVPKDLFASVTDLYIIAKTIINTNVQWNEKQNKQQQTQMSKIVDYLNRFYLLLNSYLSNRTIIIHYYEGILCSNDAVNI